MTAPTFTSPAVPPAQPELLATLTDTIRLADANKPRSTQRYIGPSEVGDPCPRRLSYKIMEVEPVNTRSDPWAAIIGTAVHAWLADTFTQANAGLDQPRWLVEQRVYPTDGIPGSCDLYDTWTRTVIDWKIVGPSRLKEYKNHGPSPQYQAQAHLYGLGWSRAGHDVAQVALAFLPRNSWLGDAHLWTDDYDPTYARKALDRLGDIVTACGLLEVDDHPERHGLIPANPGPHCTWCPFYLPGSTDPGRGCPGPEAPAPAAPAAQPNLFTNP
jgi:hypothetical protein